MTNAIISTTENSTQDPGPKYREHLPYMPVHCVNVLAETDGFSTLEFGAYQLLVFAYWRRGGSLPDDDKLLARVTRLHPNRWGVLRQRVLAPFRSIGGYLIHDSVEKQLLNSCERIALAKRSASVRWSERNATYKEVSKKEVSKKEVSKKESAAKDAGAKEAPLVVSVHSAEADLFRRGREILGPKSGGLINKLLQAKNKNPALARAAIEQASTKHDPAEYIGAILRNGEEYIRPGYGDDWG